MRKIKFRAWIDDEELCNEEEILYHLDENENFIPFMQDLDSWYFDDGQTLGDYFDCFDKEKIMQYTGLKDKKGKEIYEGDILKDEENMLWKVIFDNGCFKLENIHIPGRMFITKDIEIIGNIYENLEMMEEV